jgi:hypothetical protein
MPKITDVLDYANYIVQSQSARVEQQKKYRKVFSLDWEFKYADKPGNEWMLPVVDPRPNSSVRTAANILANKEPRVSVKIPREAIERGVFDRTSAWGVAAWRCLPMPIKRLAQPKTPVEKLQEILENVIRYAIRENDSYRDGALRRDLALDGFITDHVVVKCVDLRLARLWQSPPAPLTTLAPHASAGEGGQGDFRPPLTKGRDGVGLIRSPFIFKRVDPTSFYFEKDDDGLSYAMERYLRPIRQVQSVYRGKLKGDADALKDGNGFVLFNEIWWREGAEWWKCAFIEKPLAAYSDIEERVERTAWVAPETLAPHASAGVQENTLGFIPYVMKTCAGSGQEIMPMLYSIVESGLDARRTPP